MAKSIKIIFPPSDDTIARPAGRPTILAFGFAFEVKEVVALLIDSAGGVLQPKILRQPDDKNFWAAVFCGTTTGDDFTLLVYEKTTDLHAVGALACDLTIADLEALKFGNNPTIQSPPPPPGEPTTFGTGGTWTGSVNSVVCELLGSDGNPISPQPSMSQLAGPPGDMTSGSWGFQLSNATPGNGDMIRVTTKNASGGIVGQTTGLAFKIS
jgi:hypothetical protein